MKEKVLTKFLSKSNQYRFYRDNYYKYKKKHDSVNHRIELYSVKNDQLRERNTDLRDKVTALRERIVVLKDKIESLRNKNESLRNKNESLRNKNEDLRDAISGLKGRYKNLSKKFDFISFDEFLIYSYIFPVVKLPFSNDDKQCFAYMDYLSKHLTNIALNSNKPLVSIIMPTYNRKDRLLIAIDSVLSQSYSIFELIIIDDASSDGTLDVLNTLDDDRIKILSHAENKGVSAARNTGLKIAKGEYIAYLDSDNYWDENYLSAMVGAFLKLGDADALYSGQILYHEFDSDPFALRFGAFNKSLLHNRNYIDLNCFCHKADVYTEIGGFDESLNRFVDWDLILRISNYFKIYSVPVLLSNYYNHSDEIRISNLYDNKDELYNKRASEIIEKNIYDYPVEKSLKRQVTVIIPNYESLNILKECIEPILLFNPEIKIIIVNNNCSDEVMDYLKLLDENNNVKIIFNNLENNFTYSINQAIDLVDVDSDLLILNNDAIVSEGAISNMQKFAYENDDCGIVVPHEILYGEHPDIKKHVPYANKSLDCDITSSKIRHNIVNIPVFCDDSILELNYAPFFCIYIKRDVYDNTLGFDAEFDMHCSDRIFSDYVRHFLAMKIYQCPTSFVYHNSNVNNLLMEEDSFEVESGKNINSKRLWDV